MFLFSQRGCPLTENLNKHIFRGSQHTSISTAQVIFLDIREGDLPCGPLLQARSEEVFSSLAPGNVKDCQISGENDRRTVRLLRLFYVCIFPLNVGSCSLSRVVLTKSLRLMWLVFMPILQM